MLSRIYTVCHPRREMISNCAHMRNINKQCLKQCPRYTEKQELQLLLQRKTLDLNLKVK